MSDARPLTAGADAPPHRDTLLPPELVAAAQACVATNRAAGRTVAVAESCTGGLVAAALTEVAGASDVLLAGVVTYANDAKVRLLRLDDDLVDTFGAVSVATAWGMARGMLMASGADVAVSITGVAGPGGGTERKPVGTVVFARAIKGQRDDECWTDKRLFADNGRGGVRLQAALAALELLTPPDAPVAAPGA